MGPSHGSLTPGPGGATAVSLGGHQRGGGGRHVYWPPGDCCLPADAPLPRSPTFLHCDCIFSLFSCIFESPLDPDGGKVYCRCDPKVIFLRDCLNKMVVVGEEEESFNICIDL